MKIKTIGLGMRILWFDLLMGMVLLVVILASALPGIVTQEPAEAETRRLKALNAELTARLQVREGRIQGLIQGEAQGASRLEDWETTPSPSPAAEWTGVALLRGEVADLTARNAAMRHLLKQSKGEKNLLAPLPVETDQGGQTARIDRLHTEIARLNTRIEEATRETGEARRLRVELEAKLQERENRIVQMGHDVNALASRNGRSPPMTDPMAPEPPPSGDPSAELTRLKRELERLKQENATLKWIGSSPAPGGSQPGAVANAPPPPPPLPRPGAINHP
ncbi:MAG: hypothetical protein HQL99_05060 [Magnetococcales bacterium]|nr:hypothetical protein [Magnetococcales bacterium]